MYDLLAPTRDSRSWESNVEYAARLAATLDGTVTALYRIPAPLVLPDIAVPSLATEVLEVCREEADAAQRASQPFAAWCSALGVRAGSWQVAEGSDIAVLQAAAKWHDAVVFERGYEHDDDTGALAELGAAVLHSGLPCIVLPAAQRTPRLDTIAIAWKATPEAARALHAALPLLERAKRLVLIHGEQGESADTELLLAQAEQHLAAHGLGAQRMHIAPTPNAAGEAILDAARSVGADLLVMGAYGRTRFGEWLFGGATRHVLRAASMPVFLRH